MATSDTDRALAYLLVRLTIGAGLFGHGLVRMPKLAAFRAHNHYSVDHLLGRPRSAGA